MGNATGATHVNAGGDQRVKITFDASKSNSIYGRSSTVQPESNEWMICVVVAGQATNLGSVDVGNVMSAVAQMQASVSAVETKPILNAKAYITGTWKSSNGSSWYRTWSDGIIEQVVYVPAFPGTDRTVTLNKAMTTTTYACHTLSVSAFGLNGFDDVRCVPTTTSSVAITKTFGESMPAELYVIGY